jgi:hypothetical protein
MAQHPLNLALRFLLEICGLAAFAFWGWAWGDPWRWPLAIGLPVLASVIWGTFRTPEDASAKQHAPVPVHGIVRLTLELLFFGLAIVALATAEADATAATLAFILAGLVAVHYVLSWDRVFWLLLMRVGPRTPEEELVDPPV